MTTDLWKFSLLADMDASKYHQLIALRIAVFVVEQACPYQEADDIDEHALHLWKESNELISAYCRMYRDNKNGWHIGRVCVKMEERKSGIGRILMDKARNMIESQGGSVIHISAQTHLSQFYTDLGYQQRGEGYLEDGIPHIPMRLIING